MLEICSLNPPVVTGFVIQINLEQETTAGVIQEVINFVLSNFSSFFSCRVSTETVSVFIFLSLTFSTPVLNFLHRDNIANDHQQD